MEHCKKCDGFGYIGAYAGIKNGVCFECGGIVTKKESYAAAKKAQKEKDRIYNEKRERLYNLKGQKTSLQNLILELLETADYEELNDEHFLKFVSKRKAKLKQIVAEIKELESSK